MATYSVQIQSILYNNEPSSLIRSLRSIRCAILYSQQGHEDDVQCTVIYGDASKRPIFSKESIEEISATFSDTFKFEYVFFDENTGTAKGHNRLATNCCTDYILIMNPDIIVLYDFFSHITRPFFVLPEQVGIVEARQTPIEHPKEYDDSTGETSWAATACAITNTSLFQQLDGFDSESFFMYCDDVDYSWRVRLAGKKVIYQPLAPVFHPKRITHEGAWIATDAEKYYSAEAALMMAYKWSYDAKCKKLLKQYFASGDESLQRAAAVFKERQKMGQLPSQLDNQHKISTFVDNLYTKHRFSI